MLYFILAFIFLSLFFAVLILFPYNKVAQWLKGHVHLRTFFAGIALIVFGFIFDAEQAPVDSANELSVILPQYAAGIHIFIIAAGIICFVASFFISRLLSDNEQS
ncbi:TPA: hypothetical protein KL544_003141 [Escherichia coli]|nr:hypothetical protein [Escherichia coli]